MIEVEVVDPAGRAVSGTVKVLLEARELVLRAPLRLRVPTASVSDVVVDGGVLRMRCDAETLALHLGDRAVVSWATALTTPPPSLRRKLGLAEGSRALVLGSVDDAELAQALPPSATTDPRDEADLLVAVVDGADDLAAAVSVLRRGTPVPLWVVHPKGRAVAFGDTAIRETLRREGLRDAKSCTVSDRLTATRYHLPTLSTGRPVDG